MIDDAEEKDDDQHTEEPIVADWSNPTPDEQDQLLSLSFEELARLVGLHPELAAFLRAGLNALQSGSSGEHSAHAGTYASYNTRGAQLVNGLLQRLSEEGVSEREIDRIYDLLDKQQEGDERVILEITRAQSHAGAKFLIALGGLAAIGLVVYASRGRGSLPPTLPLTPR